MDSSGRGGQRWAGTDSGEQKWTEVAMVDIIRQRWTEMEK